MLCNNCNKNEAAVIVQMSVNGQLLSRHLCPACAQQMHMEIAKSLARAGTVLNVLKKRAEQKQSAKSAPLVPEVLCSSCGHAIRDLDGSSRMGCAQCYEAFRERIAALIRPDDPAAADPPKDPTKEIRRQLDQAVVNENYELAAVLRDKLRDGLKDGESSV
ncbi:MAG: UvrB/UvrC motif-containing protein [Christensenellales bacterium]